VVDRFPDADGAAQRGGGALVLEGRPLIQADGRHLPFRDKTFDYSIASHVIEHLSPTGAVELAAELYRVARAGYVEAPSIVYELVRDIPEHLLVVHCDAEGSIHVAPKPPRDVTQAFIDPLFYDPDFCWVVEKHNQLFFTGTEWTTEVSVISHRDWRDLLEFCSGEWAEATVQAGLADSAGSLWRAQLRRDAGALARHYLPSAVIRAVKEVRDRNRAERSRPRTSAMTRDAAFALLVCPSCHSPLNKGGERHVTCSECGLQFTIRRDGIPKLIV